MRDASADNDSFNHSNMQLTMNLFIAWRILGTLR